MKKNLEFCFKMNVIQLKDFFSVCDNGVKVRFAQSSSSGRGNNFSTFNKCPLFIDHHTK